jgi:vesicle coat complex subunit
MDIILYHKHYDKKHLAAVKAQMETLGAPTIKAIWSEVYGAWMAVEGCHRLRAAEVLGMTPVIEDVSDEAIVTMQIDGQEVEVSVAELTEELENDAPKSHIIRFK